MHLENIPDATFCDGIQDQSLLDYFRCDKKIKNISKLNKLYCSYRNKLHEESSSLKKEYDAKQVSVDNCNDIGWRTEWIWISVGLGEQE